MIGLHESTKCAQIVKVCESEVYGLLYTALMVT